MNTPNIALVRIDNRMLHGQIAITWSHHAGGNLILVANDSASEDPVRQNLMDMAAPPGMATRYFSIQKTIDVIHKASPAQKIVMVVENPQDVLRMVKGGVPIKEVNVGNMHFSEGKKQIHKTVSVNQNDIDTFRELTELGVVCTIQRMPEEEKIEIMSAVNEG
ncbi:PTS N-acetylgalactosamine transporter subunit IIB [Endozoicomonas elysicola]|uniref:PTS system N-acetylgalactosamine-specific transporter subunit IIB n=1 Tax=Endozoicomonas elysicola TaxID=305900 RepID=A0A081KGS5_9GAMM|nr:PTS N-acetylgalactosamine transporter subunit IIB [Endozoicomonas elysicola]KEI73351.1 PTS system N-acetylgalactosamine-specific transporter subunit IIB [Endozoicomonas elysicola]